MSLTRWSEGHPRAHSGLAATSVSGNTGTGGAGGILNEGGTITQPAGDRSGVSINNNRAPNFGGGGIYNEAFPATALR